MKMSDFVIDDCLECNILYFSLDKAQRKCRPIKYEQIMPAPFYIIAQCVIQDDCLARAGLVNNAITMRQ